MPACRHARSPSIRAPYTIVAEAPGYKPWKLDVVARQGRQAQGRRADARSAIAVAPAARDEPVATPRPAPRVAPPRRRSIVDDARAPQLVDDRRAASPSRPSRSAALGAVGARHLLRPALARPRGSTPTSCCPNTCAATSQGLGSTTTRRTPRRAPTSSTSPAAPRSSTVDVLWFVGSARASTGDSLRRCRADHRRRDASPGGSDHAYAFSSSCLALAACSVPDKEPLGGDGGTGDGGTRRCPSDRSTR